MILQDRSPYPGVVFSTTDKFRAKSCSRCSHSTACCRIRCFGEETVVPTERLLTMRQTAVHFTLRQGFVEVEGSGRIWPFCCPTNQWLDGDGRFPHGIFETVGCVNFFTR